MCKIQTYIVDDINLIASDTFVSWLISDVFERKVIH